LRSLQGIEAHKWQMIFVMMSQHLVAAPPQAPLINHPKALEGLVEPGFVADFHYQGLPLYLQGES